MLALGSRGGSCNGFLVLYDLSSGTEFNHVDRALATGDQVPAWKKNYLARGGKAEETLGRRFIFLWHSRGAGRRISSGNGGWGRSLIGRGAGQAVNLVEMEGMGTNLAPSTSEKIAGKTL